jgi:hypothetical protein
MFSPNCQPNIRWGIQRSPEWVSPLECSRPCYSKGYTTFLTTCGEARIEPQGGSSMLLPLVAPPSLILLLKICKGSQGGLHNNSSGRSARAPHPSCPGARCATGRNKRIYNDVSALMHYLTREYNVCFNFESNVLANQIVYSAHKNWPVYLGS